MKKFEDYTTHFTITTYGWNSVYNFVDFRSKRAGSFNYGSASLARLSKTCQVKGQKGAEQDLNIEPR